MTKKIGVILSGCGVFDGSEIHEAVLTLLYIDQLGGSAFCMAPDMNQHHVLNHAINEEMDETRNVLVESARIARGNIHSLDTVSAKDIDAVILPGGFGAAKNLCDFAIKGPDGSANAEVVRLLKEMVEAQKPIGAICIAPATVTMALAEKSPEVTIGTDVGTANAIKTMGGQHVDCKVNEIHIDTRNNIITTPAYMLGPGIKEVAEGIKKLVQTVIERA